MGITDIFKTQEEKDRIAKREAMRKALEQRQKGNRYGNTKGTDPQTIKDNNAAADEA